LRWQWDKIHYATRTSEVRLYHNPFCTNTGAKDLAFKTRLFPHVTMLPQSFTMIATIFFVLAQTIVGVSSLPESDKISNLPGQPQVKFQQFSGHITVDDQNQRALFYYFTEAEEDPASKPLVLWLNGGWFCLFYWFRVLLEPLKLIKVIKMFSWFLFLKGLVVHRLELELSVSMALSDRVTTMFLRKMIIVGTKVNLQPNIIEPNIKYVLSWLLISSLSEANVLYLESPAGVGFSYSSNKSFYGLVTDEITGFFFTSFCPQWLWTSNIRTIVWLRLLGFITSYHCFHDIFQQGVTIVLLCS